MSPWGQQLVLVMLGGALGAAGRFWLGETLLRKLGSGIPWGTLAANLLGSFAAGFLAIWLESRGPSAVYWRALLLVGLLGGFTTYSALMLESLLLTRAQRDGAMLGYLMATLLGGVLLVWLGAKAAEAVRGVAAVA
ncbi:fluoride efflux transporter CrcB [Thermomonas brevis]